LQKSRSRPPSFAGGDSPVLRSRSSTCDSIQSSSSPIANCPSRQFTLPSGLPSYTHSAGTSPKQHISVGQYLGSATNVGGNGPGNGGSSPSSASSQSVRAARNSLNMQSDLGGHVTGARKSTSTANMNSLKKRTAPAPPPGTLGSASSSSFYGTLPHPPRHSQNFDASDIRAINHKNQSLDVAYGTLPHLRSVESSPRGGGGYGYGVSQDPGGSGNGSNNSLMPAMTTFGHKRSPSGESLNRNIHLAGAKLVLPPTGELPTLKHVDKSALTRPKIPPPGPPSGECHNSHINCSVFNINLLDRARNIKRTVEREHQFHGRGTSGASP